MRLLSVNWYIGIHHPRFIALLQFSHPWVIIFEVLKLTTKKANKSFLDIVDVPANLPICQLMADGIRKFDGLKIIISSAR